MNMIGFGYQEGREEQMGKSGLHRPTWVEIDLNAVSDNINSIRKLVGDRIMIIAVVKANAYGHGLVKIGERLVEAGVNMLAVTIVEDAIELREHGINIPILIIGCILPEQIEEILRHSITPTIVNLDIARGLSMFASQYMPGFIRSEKRVDVHIKIDTGMGGIGIEPKDALNTISKIRGLGNINIEGIFTHFTSADCSDKTDTWEQINIFRNIVKELESSGLHIPIKHAHNSAAILEMPLLDFNAVRPGITIYGLYPSKYASRSINLQQVMSFKTRIVNIKRIEKARTVSYHRTYKTQRDTLVATLPVGYGDGYRREFSNKGAVLVRGQRAPVIGIVRMDFCYIDVTDVPDVMIGDEAVVFGRQGGEMLSIESVSESIGAIPYEITSGIGKDVPRVFIH